MKLTLRSAVRRIITAGRMLPWFRSRFVPSIKSVVPDPSPSIDGLEIFEIEVDGDDPRWGDIDLLAYQWCDESVRAGDFPNRPGKRIVRYVLLPCPQDNSNQGVINDTARRSLTRPDRAATEMILDARNTECVDNPIVGVCGVVQSEPRGEFAIGCVYESVEGRDLRLMKIDNDWRRHCLFVAVVSDELI